MDNHKITHSIHYALMTLILFFNISPQASAAFNGNWTEKFILKKQHWILHTPEYIDLDGFMKAGEEINIDANSFNGIDISMCGLHLKTDSTRQEFADALICAGLYPAD